MKRPGWTFMFQMHVILLGCLPGKFGVWIVPLSAVKTKWQSAETNELEKNTDVFCYLVWLQKKWIWLYPPELLRTRSVMNTGTWLRSRPVSIFWWTCKYFGWIIKQLLDSAFGWWEKLYSQAALSPNIPKYCKWNTPSNNLFTLIDQ